ncbi:MAG: hypothetical protein M2R45_04831 [Verrucomicrobia subdivision 3 bacterium]|nr:hypothetical protein [Limisphaerales bacterium]MCS1416654.1 hypothetical protein [Limisphaerales bacterium]
MSLVVTDSELRLLHLKTRMPFRYGIATMTEFPLAFVCVRLTVNGERAVGIASDLLPPKWFTKVPEKAVSEEIEEMLDVIQHALVLVRGMESESVFELWRELYRLQVIFGEEKGYPPLLSHFGTSLVERAVIEAFCRARQVPFWKAILSNTLGIRLAAIHPELNEMEPRDLLPPAPQSQVIARHTVGLGDPLETDQISEADSLGDGLPQSLEDCIRRYSLRHFKVKLAGDVAIDLPRLQAIRRVVEGCGVHDARFSLDGNEQFATFDAFREHWEVLSCERWFSWFFDRLLFVEQPLHRNCALEQVDGLDLLEWGDGPATIIDESDGDLKALPRALAFGYRGTSHKNCKGVIKGIANRCLIEKRSRAELSSPLIMSGEDLCNQGPVALLQDLAVMSCLGIQSVERNGHHYCAGLSGFDDRVRNGVLQHHPDLYHQTNFGWPSLTIDNGAIRLDSVNACPFGVALAVPFESFPTLSEWRQAR